ncbi:MAG: Maf-like protein [Bacteroidetes bacterium]|nr:Maf-like protein [Bacteroidota bacterium]
MLKEILKNHNLILASGSPRRQDFFKKLDLEYTIDVREVEEVFSENLQRTAITDYLAQLKASVFKDLQAQDILVTSDTIVWFEDKAIGKPKDPEDAKQMLRTLSGQMHEVFTSVCFTSRGYQKTVHDTTKVWFKELTDAEIAYYVEQYSPFDKAGSYGIQDWLGYIAIDKIEGCFFNVMGLPTRLVYKTLMEIAKG